MFSLLQDVRARQQVAADQTGTSGHSQKHQSGRREFPKRKNLNDSATESIKQQGVTLKKLKLENI